MSTIARPRPPIDSGWVSLIRCGSVSPRPSVTSTWMPALSIHQAARTSPAGSGGAYRIAFESSSESTSWASSEAVSATR
jgi:hypothetical protein